MLLVWKILGRYDICTCYVLCNGTGYLSYESPPNTSILRPPCECIPAEDLDPSSVSWCRVVSGDGQIIGRRKVSYFVGDCVTIV